MAKPKTKKSETSADVLQSPRNKSVCIVCKEEKNGFAVKDDVIIGALRSIKRAFGVAANNRLVVCAECAPEHKAKRARFERNLALYCGLGALILIVFTILSRTLQGFVTSLALGMFVAFLSIFSYHPSSEASEAK